MKKKVYRINQMWESAADRKYRLRIYEGPLTRRSFTGHDKFELQEKAEAWCRENGGDYEYGTPQTKKEKKEIQDDDLNAKPSKKVNNPSAKRFAITDSQPSSANSQSQASGTNSQDSFNSALAASQEG